MVMPVLGIFVPDKNLRRISNLLSIMENPVGDIFLLMEYYLKKRGFVKEDNSFRIGSRRYKKIVLTPLMMDFGNKNIRSGAFYNIPPRKPIAEQVIDLFNGIRKYTEKKLIKKGDNEYGYEDDRKENKLFEIYPFMGINTANYELKEMEELFDKYFSEYTGKEEDFFQNMGTFDGNIDNLGNNSFLGIKVYPPLGFDPWPERGIQRDKVEKLYAFCVEKEIPLTAHCSDGGFLIKKEYKNWSSPQKWKAVLKNKPFKGLRINLAHLANQGKILCLISQSAWRENLFRLISRYENVYTDFSCQAFNNREYQSLKETIECYSYIQDLDKRILFGTDFMINLIWVDSYNDYLRQFSRTTAFSDEDKFAFCNRNSRSFLFNT